MGLQLIPHGAPAVNAVTPSGRLRGLATVIGLGHAEPPGIPPPDIPLAPGRVTSGGTWTEGGVLRALAGLLGPTLAPALRHSFEWYLCRGAFFHNDAHFEDVLFGVWCVSGPAAEVVFPRAGMRADASPGHAVVFDPFEVHGVLAPGRAVYAAEDYAVAAPSVFVGFELAITEAVADAFRLSPPSSGRTLSSRTRIAAVTGAFE